MKILFLSTWFPYPLSQGCKIRAYHLLEALAQKHEVTLVSFEDAPVEKTWIEEIGLMCARVEIVQCDPFAHGRFKSLLGWFSWRPSAVLSSFSLEMLERVKRVSLEWKPDRVVALTFVTAPYAAEVKNIPRVVDVDNLMTRMMYDAYRKEKTSFKRVRSWLAWRKFRGYERSLYRKFNRCLVVSEQDCQVIRKIVPLPADRVSVMPNGVDLTTHFPGLCDPDPGTLIFNGALTYYANYRAMQFFLRDIYPSIQVGLPDARLRITGSTSGVPLDQLPSSQNVFFTGFLDDIRPVVSGSWVCVVPLLEGGGTRVKILEAMALGTPVVSTSKGAEGLEAVPGEHLLIADEPGEFANQTLRVLKDPALRQKLAGNAVKLVRDKYNWDRLGRDFCLMVENLSPILKG